MKKITLLLLTLPMALSAQKKEIETTARITDVTVYTSAAEIYSEKEITLPRGKSTIVFTELTPFIVENSVNVALSKPDVNIITVSERINYATDRKNINEQVVQLQDSLAKMERELGLLHYRREAAEAERSLLFKGESIGGLSTQGVAVAEIEKASAFFSKRYLELGTQLFYFKEREAQLDSRIKKYQDQLKELETVSIQNTSEIKVIVNSPTERTVIFKLHYLTPSAGWSPLYDFKYEGPTQPLQFVFRANVFNASGVAWQDVSLHLSTADPLRGFAPPSVNNQSMNQQATGGVKFKQIEVVNAIVEYSITQQYSVPSDAKPYLVDVDAYPMPSSYNYLLIPKVDPFGFLMAGISGWNRYNLIPGTANIYNAGSYMGKTFLDTYADNDTLALYLGKDKNIQAQRSEQTVRHTRFLAGNYTTEESTVDIKLKNNFTLNLQVEVLDQVPIFSKDEGDKITLYNIADVLYDKAEGLLTWHYTLKPGEVLPIHYRYEIKSPKELYNGMAKRRKYRSIACPTF